MKCSKTPVSLDYLVRNCEHTRWDGQAERPSSSKVDDELEGGRLLHRQIGRFGTFQYLVHIAVRRYKSGYFGP